VKNITDFLLLTVMQHKIDNENKTGFETQVHNGFYESY